MRNIADKAKSFFKNIIEDMRVIYAEKGIEPFKKPLLYALPVLLIVYAFIYSPSVKKLSDKTYEYENLKAISLYYADYESAKLKLRGYQNRLPAIKDKADWLNYILTKTAKKHGIVFDSMASQKEVEISNVLIVSRDVSVNSDYHTIGKWISDIENYKVFVKITGFSLKKIEANPGKCKINLTLSTVFAKYAL